MPLPHICGSSTLIGIVVQANAGNLQPADGTALGDGGHGVDGGSIGGSAGVNGSEGFSAGRQGAGRHDCGVKGYEAGNVTPLGRGGIGVGEHSVLRDSDVGGSAPGIGILTYGQVQNGQGAAVGNHGRIRSDGAVSANDDGVGVRGRVRAGGGGLIEALTGHLAGEVILQSRCGNTHQTRGNRGGHQEPPKLQIHFHNKILLLNT